MSISTKAVCNKITSIIASKTLNAAEAAALSVSCNIDIQTSTWAGLPAAACNEGRFYYVTDCCGYHYSDGTAWQNCVISTNATPAKLVYSVGCNSSGQLGDNTTVTKSSPVSVTGGITTWTDVSVKKLSGFGITSDGTIWSWGSNANGILGDNTGIDKSSPVSVVGGFTWCNVSAGGISHVMALKNDNTAWGWGIDVGGKIGNGIGAGYNRSSPVSVVGGFTWCKVEAAYSSSIGIKNDGTLWAWGYGYCGQLGDGTTTDKCSPISVVGGFADWCEIGSGTNRIFGIRANGTLWAWGKAYCGTLGDGTTVDKSSPVSVVGGFTDWCQATGGLFQSLGIRTNGTAWAWGCGAGLGANTITPSSSPISVVGGFTDWCQIDSSGNRVIAARTNGTAWSWGSTGCLGDGGIAGASSPVSITGGFTDWVKVSAGYNSTLLLRSRG